MLHEHATSQGSQGSSRKKRNDSSSPSCSAKEEILSCDTEPKDNFGQPIKRHFSPPLLPPRVERLSKKNRASHYFQDTSIKDSSIDSERLKSLRHLEFNHKDGFQISSQSRSRFMKTISRISNAFDCLFSKKKSEMLKSSSSNTNNNSKPVVIDATSKNCEDLFNHFDANIKELTQSLDKSHRFRSSLKCSTLTTSVSGCNNTSKTAPTSPSSGEKKSSNKKNVHHFYHYHFHHHHVHHHIHHYPVGTSEDVKTGDQNEACAYSTSSNNLYQLYDDLRNIKRQLDDGAPMAEKEKCSSIKLSEVKDVTLKKSMWEISKCGWYWGQLKFQDAEKLLLSRPNGTFLLRDSMHDENILSLSFRVEDNTYHTRIEHKNGRYSFWSQPESHSAASIVEFIYGAVAHSRSGKYHYFLQSSEVGRPPVEVPLLYPISRYQTVQSLKQLCRLSIITNSSLYETDRRMSIVSRLPIPPDLMTYLMEKQYFFDDIDEIESQLKGKPPLLISTNFNNHSWDRNYSYINSSGPCTPLVTSPRNS